MEDGCRGNKGVNAIAASDQTCVVAACCQRRLDGVDYPIQGMLISTAGVDFGTVRMQNPEMMYARIPQRHGFLALQRNN